MSVNRITVWIIWFALLGGIGVYAFLGPQLKPEAGTSADPQIVSLLSGLAVVHLAAGFALRIFFISMPLMGGQLNLSDGAKVQVIR